MGFPGSELGPHSRPKGPNALSPMNPDAPWNKSAPSPATPEAEGPEINPVRIEAKETAFIESVSNSNVTIASQELKPVVTNSEHLAELILHHCERRWGRSHEDAEPVLVQEVAAIVDRYKKSELHNNPTHWWITWTSGEQIVLERRPTRDEWESPALEKIMPLFASPIPALGWVMVPREPTDAMLQALHIGWQDAKPDGEWLGEPTTSSTAMHRASYKAAIAAAPVAPKVAE